MENTKHVTCVYKLNSEGFQLCQFLSIATPFFLMSQVIFCYQEINVIPHNFCIDVTAFKNKADCACLVPSQTAIYKGPKILVLLKLFDIQEL